jgi:Bacterial SH3 domain/Outer membrane protein beta-barrel domain
MQPNTPGRHLKVLAFLLLQYLVMLQAHGENRFFEVQVTEPYIELHTGPGRGYPVFYVVDRGEHVEVITRKTDWFKVRTQKGKEGWVSRAQMETTLTASGEKTRFAEPGMGDFSNRRWEAGLIGGTFEGADMITVYGAFAMSPNLSAELSASQVFSNYSNAYMGIAALVAQPFPEWRISPFFLVGTGIIYTDSNVTVVNGNDGTDQIGSVGAGIRCYLTRRFILRAEYRNSVIFHDSDDNQEINEWQAGFAFFF